MITLMVMETNVIYLSDYLGRSGCNRVDPFCDFERLAGSDIDPRKERRDVAPSLCGAGARAAHAGLEERPPSFQGDCAPSKFERLDSVVSEIVDCLCVRRPPLHSSEVKPAAAVSARQRRGGQRGAGPLPLAGREGM